MYDKEMLDLRKQIISSFYNDLLGRDPDEAGLANYVNSPLILEGVYKHLLDSDEYTNKQEEKKRELLNKQNEFSLGLATFVKNNSDSIGMMLDSVKDIISEIVVLDTGSTDNTPEICEERGARVYKCLFTDFGNIRTIAAHLIKDSDFVLMLDSDEIILQGDLFKFKEILQEKDKYDAWALPRKRWLDLDMKTQLEKGVYPDWQVRLFKNSSGLRYERRVHEVLKGTDRVKRWKNGPCIQHFQDSFKGGKKLKERNNFYNLLYNKDIKEGVKHDGHAVTDLDKKE